MFSKTLKENISELKNIEKKILLSNNVNVNLSSAPCKNENFQDLKLKSKLKQLIIELKRD